MALAAITLAAGTIASGAARAQFFWDQPELSADDAARAAISRGFTVLARPTRNEDVYVADVIDRRGLRERLMIAADTGRIVQRSFVEPGRTVRSYDDPTLPPGPVPPGRIPNEDRRPGVFSRLFGDDPKEEARLPADRSFDESDRPVRPPRHRPRVVEQEPETVRQTPMESEPLASPPGPSVGPPRLGTPLPLTHRAPVQAALPPPTVTPPVSSATPVPTAAAPAPDHRSISTNPLAIPGSREQDEKNAPRPSKAAGTLGEQPRSAAKAPSADQLKDLKPLKLEPASAAPAKAAVPVAPLE